MKSDPVDKYKQTIPCRRCQALCPITVTNNPDFTYKGWAVCPRCGEQFGVRSMCYDDGAR
jgi:hypothetical protein